jgi:large subunit ribosomal protein L18
MSEFSNTRRSAWLKRKKRVGKGLSGSDQRPRLTVFRSHRHIYAQIVDDDKGHTLVSCDSKRAGETTLPEGFSGKRAMAYRVGRALAEIAKEKGVATVVFDRNGYLYHGRVEALAKGARDGGLEF